MAASVLVSWQAATPEQITISGNGLGSGATYAVVERSFNGGGADWVTVRGGSAMTVTSGATDDLIDYEWQTGTKWRITSYNDSDVQQEQAVSLATSADVDEPWLIVPAAPFLNTTVKVFGVSDVTRRSRAGVFDVVGRSNPVMVGDITSSVEFELQLLTETASETSDLDFLFASGEVVFLRFPDDVNWAPGGYYSVGDTSRTAVSKVSASRIWTVPLTGVAAPGPDVVGSAYTWTSAVNEYDTWTELIADNATWSDLLARTGTPADVIVP